MVLILNFIMLYILYWMIYYETWELCESIVMFFENYVLVGTWCSITFISQLNFYYLSL